MSDRRNVIPEASVITDFAITSVNVPDRLDAQEVRARTEAESDTPRSGYLRFRSIRRWLFLVFAAVGIASVAVVSHRALAPIWAEVSAEKISARLSQTMGRPVQVASAGIRLAPTPRLVVEGIEVPAQFRIDSVSLRFTWGSVAKLVRGSAWDWGEATVGPLELTGNAAFALINALPALSKVMPAPVTTLKFESIRLRDVEILPGRYLAVAERAPDQSFSRIAVEDLDGRGQLNLQILLDASAKPTFRLRAYQWRPPFGPATEWAELSAEGSFAPDRLQVQSYSAIGFLGVVTGSLDATRASGWTIRGTVQSTNIDLVSVQRELRKQTKAPVEAKATPVLQGVMDASGTLSGQGASLSEALDRTTASGKVRVRLATLNGINLGANAVASGSGSGLGGVTRFGDLEAVATLSSSGVRLKDIAGSAGALQVKGAIGIERNLAIGGILRAEVMTAGGVAPSDVRVSGSALEPSFEN